MSKRSERRVKKVQIAIDKMIELYDIGNTLTIQDRIQRIIEQLRDLESRVEEK